MKNKPQESDENKREGIELVLSGSKESFKLNNLVLYNDPKSNEQYS